MFLINVVGDRRRQGSVENFGGALCLAVGPDRFKKNSVNDFAANVMNNYCLFIA